MYRYPFPEMFLRTSSKKRASARRQARAELTSAGARQASSPCTRSATSPTISAAVPGLRFMDMRTWLRDPSSGPMTLALTRGGRLAAYLDECLSDSTARWRR